MAELLDEEFLSQDPCTIQRELAKQYREATGSVPKGQLWQPCAVRDCNREPVCMNCFKCQEEHCHCFDGE